LKTIRLLGLSDIFALLIAKMDYLKVNISMHFDLRKTAADPGYENLTKPHIQIGPCGQFLEPPLAEQGWTPKSWYSKGQSHC
jgi:hypothetical protein